MVLGPSPPKWKKSTPDRTPPQGFFKGIFWCGLNFFFNLRKCPHLKRWEARENPDATRSEPRVA